jgi:hypothetical protein
MYSGNSETSEIVNNQCVSCWRGTVDMKGLADNSRSGPAGGVLVTTSH